MFIKPHSSPSGPQISPKVNHCSLELAGLSNTEVIRNTQWLADRLKLLWDNHFANSPKGFPIVAKFGNRAQYRFGSICARNGVSIISVNQLFADPYVPVFVVDGTLAHELAHYVHGYGSGLPKRYPDPHRGGVVEKELEKRGLGEIDRGADRWRESCWDAFYQERCGDITDRKAARAEQTVNTWNTFINRPSNRGIQDIRGRVSLLAPSFGFTTSPFEIEWLTATKRQTGISYWFAKSKTVRIHGLVADRRVPGVVVDFEVAYWLARLRNGDNWPEIHKELRRARLEEVAEEALRWRRGAWTNFRNRHHPLN